MAFIAIYAINTLDLLICVPGRFEYSGIICRRHLQKDDFVQLCYKICVQVCVFAKFDMKYLKHDSCMDVQAWHQYEEPD